MPPWWSLVLCFIFFGVWVSILFFGRIDERIFYLVFNFLVIPSILITLLIITCSIIFLFGLVDCIWFSRTGKLVLTERSVCFESERPTWWPLNKSISILWSEPVSVNYYKTRGNFGIVLKSRNGKITVLKSHYSDLEKVLVELSRHLKKPIAVKF